MARSRDPISLEYDSAALTILAALQLRRSWPPQGVPVLAWVDVPLLDLPDGVPGSLMTRHERGFVRALYYNLKLMRPARSVRLPVWGERNLRGFRACRFTAFTKSQGQEFVEAVPEVSYVENPDLQTWAR
jgi:hypothetical protein